MREAEESGAKVVVLDIPLLFETGGDKRCDAVVVVSAPAEVQRQRAFERPGMTEEKFEALLAQADAGRRKAPRADFVVDTGKGFDAAHAQVVEFFAQVATMANEAGRLICAPHDHDREYMREIVLDAETTGLDPNQAIA